MQKLVSILFVFLWTTLSSCAQPAQEIRLIIRGDDMGFAHAANQAMIDCYKKGIMTTVEVMPVTPWFPEAVRLCNENPNLDVGIHLTLTSEWDNLKWRPLTQVPSLTDEMGFFFPMVWPNDNYSKEKTITGNSWKLEEVEKEIRAQIELSIKAIPHISHVTTHMGFSSMGKEVANLLKRLTIEYGIDIDLDELGVESVRLKSPKGKGADRVENYLEMLEGLEAGKTYMHLEHPGYDYPELQAVRHIGYNDVATDRASVTQAWTDQRVKDLIAKKGIKLISYADLKK